MTVGIENIGYQKPMAILISGVDNITNVTIKPVNVWEKLGKQAKSEIYGFFDGTDAAETDKIKVNVDDVHFIDNNEDNCVYSFIPSNETNNLKSGDGVQTIDDEGNDSPVVVGHLYISKLKYPVNHEGLGIGIPFLINVEYEGNDKTKKIEQCYFVVFIPYDTMGNILRLPLYYRPFYFNSVLLLTPETMWYEKTETITNSDGTTTKNTEQRLLGYDYDMGDVCKVSTNKLLDENTREKVYEYNIKVNTNAEGKNDIVNKFKYQLKYNEDIKQYQHEITAMELKLKDSNGEEHVYELKGRELTAVNVGYGSFEVEIQDNNDPNIKEKVLICYTFGNANGQNDMIFNGELKVKRRLNKNHCYGRLFYSIANGCSMREDYDSTHSIYKLDNATLSYINGDNIGSTVIENPFRCFSEMEGSVNGISTTMKIGGSDKGSDKLTRMMMYGITEPFRKQKIVGSEKIVEPRYITQPNNSTEKVKNMKIKYAFGALYDEKSGGASPKGEDKPDPWEHTIMWGKKGNGKIIMDVNWTTYYGYVSRQRKIKQTHYKNVIEFTINEDAVFDFDSTNNADNIEIKNGKTAIITYDYRRTNATWNPKLTLVKKDENVKIECDFNIVYTLKSVSTGRSIMEIEGKYNRKYDVDFNIKRDGFPILKSDPTFGIFDVKNNENCKVVDEGIRQIYSDIDTSSGYGNLGNNVYKASSGELISIYEDIDYITPIKFDMSKWSDFSFSVEEAHEDGDDNYNTAFAGFNDVKFYDDIYWDTRTETTTDANGSETKTTHTGVYTDGYSSDKVRYFAMKKGDGWENEIDTLLGHLCGIGARYENGTYIRYMGVNINDNIQYVDPRYPYSSYCGWKSIHSHYKQVGTDSGNNVYLSGKGTKNSTHECIDITAELKANSKKEYTEIKDLLWRCSALERPFIIGVYDNYTSLDGDDYEKENDGMYSVIKKHTSRFAIIRLYYIDNKPSTGQ